MPLLIETTLAWIKSDFGGLDHAPTVGLRPTIRLQRDVNAWLSLARDVQIVRLEIDPNTWQGTAKLVFPNDATQGTEGLKVGELIELLSAYRVIAVGKILSVNPNGILP